MTHPAKKKTRAVTAAELEHILEDLMLEVADSCPTRTPIEFDGARLQTWAHMTAMYVSEVVKRRASDRETIIKKAKKAVRRRIERELADSYLGMVLPTDEGGGEEGLRLDPTAPVPFDGNSDGKDDEEEGRNMAGAKGDLGGVDGLQDSVTEPEADK